MIIVEEERWQNQSNFTITTFDIIKTQKERHGNGNMLGKGQ